MTVDTDEGARSFARFLEQIADGDAQRALSRELRELCLKLRDEAQGRSAPAKGELTLTLKLKAEPNDVVQVVYDIKTKQPKPIHPSGVMWMTKGGNLSPSNPRQQKLPLKEVGGIERESARDVGDEPRVAEV